MYAVGALHVIWQRIPRQHRSDSRIDRNDQRVPGICGRISAGALIFGRHREHLRRPQHLAKALILTEIKRLSTPVIDMRQYNRSTIGEAEFIPPERRILPGFTGDE